MFPFRTMLPRGVLSLGLCAVGLMLCGCERSEQITTYTMPKHETLQTQEFLKDQKRRHPDPERMLALITPRGKNFWFFKLQGPVDAVAAREKEVRSFLESVRFPTPVPPAPVPLAWTLPNGWKQLPATEMRYATLVMEGDPVLEIAVSALPIDEKLPMGEQVLRNVNRWRSQLSLPSIEEDDLPVRTEKLTIGDADAWFVNIVGRPGPKQKMQPPPQMGANVPIHEPRHEQKPLEFEKPDGWDEAAPGIAAVAFEVVDGKSTVKITVTPAMGGRFNNVNRWRGQLKLEPLTEEQVAKEAKKVAVGRKTGEQFDMSNNGRSIFAVMVENRDRTWFIKLDGDSALAEKERSRFDAFVKSLQLD